MQGRQRAQTWTLVFSLLTPKVSDPAVTKQPREGPPSLLRGMLCSLSAKCDHFDIKEFQIMSEGNLLRLISHISPASAYLSHSRHSLKKPSPSLTLPTNRSMRSQSAKRVHWAGCITGSSPCSSQPPLSTVPTAARNTETGTAAP